MATNTGTRKTLHFDCLACRRQICRLFFLQKKPIKNSFFWKIKHIVYVTKKSFGKKEKKMVKKKILPWLSVLALIFALPVNAAENNTFIY